MCVPVNQYTLQILFSLTSIYAQVWCSCVHSAMQTKKSYWLGIERMDARGKRREKPSEWYWLNGANSREKSFISSFCNVNNRLMWNNQQNTATVHTNSSILYTHAIKLSVKVNNKYAFHADFPSQIPHPHSRFFSILYQTRMVLTAAVAIYSWKLMVYDLLCCEHCCKNVLCCAIW